jgi:small-conductance mechanosensitive channel
MTFFALSSHQLWLYLQPLLIVAIAALAGLVVERFAVRWLAHVAWRTAWQGEVILKAALRGKLVLWSALYGIWLALEPFPWPAGPGARAEIHTWIRNGVLVVFVLSLTLMFARLASLLIGSASRPDTRPALSIVSNIVRATIYICGAIAILAIFSIQVTPALAALGVGGLAVSLALQATLTDFVSGLQIIAARQIRPGDYIKLSTGEEGYVSDINWRTTTVRQLANNLVIIPNAHMTSSIVTNYHAPETRLAVPVDVAVGYDADLDEVEHVTLEVARAVMREVEGDMADAEPLLRYAAFGKSNIQFHVVLRAQEYAGQYALKHEFIKRLHRRYRAEGIEFPYPARTIQIRGAAPSLAAVASDNANNLAKR